MEFRSISANPFEIIDSDILTSLLKKCIFLHDSKCMIRTRTQRV